MWNFQLRCFELEYLFGYVLETRCVLCGYDATVFPANAGYARQSILAVAAILGMSPSNCCHYQVPIYQSQTTVPAMVKHRRLIEDQLIASKLSIVNSIQLLFCKEDSSARDQRALSQPAVALLHTNFSESPWHSSRALVEGKVGPVPLLPVAQFLGYDDTSRPGASARVEQILDSSLLCCQVPLCVLCFNVSFLFCFCFHWVHLACISTRKGVQCHKQILEGYMAGMDIKPEDRFIFVDLVPNRRGIVWRQHVFAYRLIAIISVCCDPTLPHEVSRIGSVVPNPIPVYLQHRALVFAQQVCRIWEGCCGDPLG